MLLGTTGGTAGVRLIGTWLEGKGFSRGRALVGAALQPSFLPIRLAADGGERSGQEAEKKLVNKICLNI